MSQSATDDTAVTDPSTGAGARENWSLILLFIVVTVVGIVLSTGVLNLGVVDAEQGSSDTISIPLYIYLYASLGALGYMFTKLRLHIESYDETSELDRLVALALRIPAAWVLGAGTYLLSAAILPATASNSVRFTAGVAFLVGLYVNVAMKSLGSLADRLLGRKSLS